MSEAELVIVFPRGAGAGLLPSRLAPLAVDLLEVEGLTTAALAQRLGSVRGDYVWLAPPNALPMGSGLSDAVARLKDDPDLIGAGGPTVAFEAPGADGAWGTASQLTWSIPFPSTSLLAEKGSERVAAFGPAAPSFHGAVWRRDALITAAHMTADVGAEPLAQHIGLGAALAAAGRSTCDGAPLSVTPGGAFAWRRNRDAVYRAMVDPDWYVPLASALDRVATFLLTAESTPKAGASPSFFARLKRLISPQSPGPEAFAVADAERVDDIVRSAAGDVIGALLRASPTRSGETGLGAVLEALQGVGLSPLRLARLEQELLSAVARPAVETGR